MTTYILKEQLTQVTDTEAVPPHSVLIQVASYEEYFEQYQDSLSYHILSRNLAHIHYCKADILNDSVTGTFSVPIKDALGNRRQNFGFCLDHSSLLFVDDHQTVVPILEHMRESLPNNSEMPSALHFLFTFMEELIKDDVFFLQDYEERLEKLEEKLLKEAGDDFNSEILHLRKRLASLGAYYEQLADMGGALAQSAPDTDQEKSGMLFSLYTNRVSRLSSSVGMLKEYSMQLRELHQSQIDLRQNQSMKVLTIVTTLFMPLTLVAGWYGMNFVHMPELSSPYGYGIICIVSVLIVVVEILLFKLRKWFR